MISAVTIVALTIILNRVFKLDNVATGGIEMKLRGKKATEILGQTVLWVHSDRIAADFLRSVLLYDH